jgi:hypothetical protein
MSPVNPVAHHFEAPEPSPVQVSAFSKLFQNVVPAAILQAVLSALLLVLVCNWHSFYEEDQPAKTAQILSLAVDSNWAHLPTTTSYYELYLFTSYFLAATFFYKVTHLPAVEALNVFSMLCGVGFFAIMPIFLRRAFHLPQWLSWLMLISAPLLIITFNYGNEAAFAILMVALAAYALTFKTTSARVIAGACYVAAAYGRSDYLFLWPALGLLTLARKDGQNAVDWRQTWRNVRPFLIASAVFGLAYLFLVLRVWPQPPHYRSHQNWKLFVAYFVFSPNYINALLAGVGLLFCLWRRDWKYLLLLPACVQAAPYLTTLNSPKYILPTVVVMLIFAVVGILPLWRRSRALAVLLIALPWVVALTPYGIFGPTRAAYWYVPTDDGPLPTGGFIGFYARVKEGFYQTRYDQEARQIREGMQLVEQSPAHGNLVGFFMVGILRLWEASNQRWELPASQMPFWKIDLSDKTQPNYLIKITYLNPIKHIPALAGQLEPLYRNGQIKAATSDPNDPFPDVIECGTPVPPGTDNELGARILFISSHFKKNHIIRRTAFIKDFSGVSWISKARFLKEKFQSKPVYEDSQWVCFDENIPDAVYYSMRFPIVYAAER